MNTPDDVTLIEQFLSRSAILTANQTLKIEPAFGTNRLLTTTGTLLATIDLTTKPIIVNVRQGCDYWVLLHEALSSQGFMMAGLSPQIGFMRYEAQMIPVGYTMHCTEARSLWEVWSDSVRSFNCRDIRLDVLIFDRSTWYPIQEVVGDRGIVSIQTLISKLSLQDGDYVTWLRRSGSREL
ncbi:hypothetical protein ACKFKG_05585 [Phormidesmis sp. 146-35]